MTREAFENGIVVAMALGGSTNLVLHCLALAKEADVALKIEDYNEINAKVSPDPSVLLVAQPCSSLCLRRSPSSATSSRSAST